MSGPRRIGRAGLVTAIVVLASLALLPLDASTPDLAHRLAAPSPAHPLGTDHLGRDVLARLAVGARWTVGFALLAVTVCAVAGTAVGTLAGYAGGLGAGTLLRVIDVLVALPAVLFGLVLAAVLGPGPIALLTAVCVAGWTPFARLAFQLAVREGGSGYVESAVALGAGRRWILARHILPNAARPLLAHAVLRLAHTLLAVSGLSFLGLGVQPPTPEWGAMLADGRNYVFVAPGLVLAPAAAVLAVAVLVTVLGRLLERRWDAPARTRVGRRPVAARRQDGQRRIAAGGPARPRGAARAPV